MSNLKVNTPFSYHVHLVVTQERKEWIIALKNNNFLVSSSICSDKTSNIEDAIYDSQKTLFLLSKKDVQNKKKWLKHVARIASEKAEAHSSHDMTDIIVVTLDKRAENLSEKQMTDLGFENFIGKHVVYDGTKKETDFVQNELGFCLKTSCLTNLKREPNLGGSLACTYYYGYLKIIMQQYHTEISDKRNEFEGKDSSKNVMCEKFFLIIPKSLSPRQEKCEVHDSKMTMDTASDDVDGFNLSKLKINMGQWYKSGFWEFSFAEKSYGCYADIPRNLMSVQKVITSFADHPSQPQIMTKGKKWEIIQFYEYLNNLIRYDPICRKYVKFIFYDDEADSSLWKVLSIEVEKEIRKEQKQCVTPNSPEIEPPSFTADMGISRISGDEHQDDAGSFDDEADDSMMTEEECQFISLHGPHYPISTSGASIRTALYMNHVTDDRSAYDEHVKNICRCLGFKLDDFCPSPGSTMREKVCDYESSGEAFICVIRSYGKDGWMLDADGKITTLRDLTAYIGRDDSLMGKPKIFIIDAAQSTADYPPTTSTDLESEQAGAYAQVSQGSPCADQTPKVEDNVPYLDDILVFYSGSPGAWTEGKHSLRFMKTLEEEVTSSKNTSDPLDIEQVFRSVITKTQEIAQGIPGQRRHKPYMLSTLKKYIRFQCSGPNSNEQ